MVSMKLCNFVVFVMGLAVGGAIMGASAGFPMEITDQGPGPGFWPFLLGLALTVAALVLAVYTFCHRQELTEEKVNLGTAANRQGKSDSGHCGQPAGLCGDGPDSVFLRTDPSDRFLCCGYDSCSLYYVPAGVPG